MICIGGVFMTYQQAHKIPDALMEQLDRAREQFHAGRMGLEKAMDGTEYRHQERISAAQTRLREAERAVEHVEAKIKELLYH
jgi:hypothetical protein